MLKVVESYLKGHPDKVCDQVADTILDEFLRRDRRTRATIEVFAGHGAMMVSGEVRSRADFDVAAVAKRVYKECGYTDEIEPFVHLGEWKREWGEMLSKGAASDQAICYGYATRGTREMLPPAVVYANAVAHKIDESREHDARMKWLKPDGYVMVAVDGKDVRQVCVFAQHMKDVKVKDVHNDMMQYILRPSLGDLESVKLFVNPAGPFTQGGLSVGTGKSGSRTASDLYGGLIPQSNGSLSGKDPSHPLRAGNYMARHIAKWLVANGHAGQALVKIVYMVGRVDPIVVEATGDVGADLSELVKETFDLRIESIVEQFNLRKPIYRDACVYGHVGRKTLPWESTELTKKEA